MAGGDSGGGGGSGSGGGLVKSCRPKISAIFETSDIRVGEVRIDVEKLVRCSERSGDQPIRDGAIIRRTAVSLDEAPLRVRSQMIRDAGDTFPRAMLSPLCGKTLRATLADTAGRGRSSSRSSSFAEDR